MSVQKAAQLLQSHLREKCRAAWLTAVGIGETNGSPCIIVYVRRAVPKQTAFLNNGWYGFPVVIEKMGTPRLLKS
jgi:hypothetical protein